MIDYRAGAWGFHVSYGLNGSLAPRALTMAIPNALLTLLMALLYQTGPEDTTREGPRWFKYDNKDRDWEKLGESAQMVIGAFTAVMLFILYNRSRTSYNRWWEGGTLLQKTRGEWFNAYSSIMAFTSTKPELQHQVEEYTHLLARLMSLLMCCGLQQVSPHRDRPFAILDLEGIEPESFEFLNQAPDKVEIILQWIQRSMVLHMQTGVLPTAPPILSRAFQEISRGIVNLQNARKIADFPYPFPLAQISMIMQLLHWAMVPIASPLAMPKGWAILFSFFTIFALWCIHFNALDLEFPFGDRVNDLPMKEFQQDWNNSICSLLDKRATRPPTFQYDPLVHNEIKIAMSDASALYVPQTSVRSRGTAMIKVTAGNLKVKRNSNIGPKAVSREAIIIQANKDMKKDMIAQPNISPGGSSQTIGKLRTSMGDSQGDRSENNVPSESTSPTSDELTSRQAGARHALARGPTRQYVSPKDVTVLVEESMIGNSARSDDPGTVGSDDPTSNTRVLDNRLSEGVSVSAKLTSPLDPQMPDEKPSSFVQD